MEREREAPDIKAKLLDLIFRGRDEYVRKRDTILHEELAVLGEHPPDEAIARVEQRIAERARWPCLAK